MKGTNNRESQWFDISKYISLCGIFVPHTIKNERAPGVSSSTEERKKVKKGREGGGSTCRSTQAQFRQ